MRWVRSVKDKLPVISATLVAAVIALSSGAWAANSALTRSSDITSTKHNLSSVGTSGKDVYATSETEICVFCHTAHGSNSSVGGPLWNRGASTTATYDVYDSSSLDSGNLPQPAGSSKLCLSCHDGTVAIGSVSNGPGSGGVDATVAMTISGGGTTMPSGSGGDSRNLGDTGNDDLTNDHPISVTFDSTLWIADGELREMTDTPELVGVPSASNDPSLPLEPNSGDDQIQCATCHDPHTTGTETFDSSTNETAPIKFLRLRRFQGRDPSTSGDTFNTEHDIICLACHMKGRDTDADDMADDLAPWNVSAHANPNVAEERYAGGQADNREFPRNIKVWEASCLNCHDPHTEPNANRLLRDGAGGVEDVCYQCHAPGAGIIRAADDDGVPDIETDFGLTYTMPITASPEVHDIKDADFTEDQETLGYKPADPDKGNKSANRHVECTDCHNPHRVLKKQCFNAGTAVNCATSGTYTSEGNAGTHRHEDGHTNIISGVLTGTWGVEPKWDTNRTSWYIEPTSFVVKQGIPPANATPGSNFPDADDGANSRSYVTREYQICFKCHSNYSWDWGNSGVTGDSSNEIANTSTGGPTCSGCPNNVATYTNIAREMMPVNGNGNTDSDPNRNSTTYYQGTGASRVLSSNNHRSWHPVMAPTGRTSYASRWEPPWDAAKGTQTMYCTDCHGSETNSNGTSVPDGGDTTNNGIEDVYDANPWGPHGSTRAFILKGTWSAESHSGDTGVLCFRCHSQSDYNGTGNGGGFVHGDHRDKIGSTLECSWCHIMVPHGWKNKAFVANLDDVGPEAGNGTFGQTPGSNYDSAPYYWDAYTQIPAWRASGSWGTSQCRGDDWMSNNCGNPQ